MFRVDASSTIGLGHLMRCLSLARAWREKGAEPIFVCRNLPGLPTDLIRTHDLDVRFLPDIGSPEPGTLGVSPTEDSAQTRDAAGECDWLVADHYGIDVMWERESQPWAKRILTLSDGPGPVHEVNALLDPTLGVLPTAYADQVTAGTGLYLGPSFALLRPEFARLRAGAKPRDAVHRILIGMGGADPMGMTLRLIETLGAIDGVEIKTIVGPSFRNGDEIRSAAAKLPNMEVLAPTDRIGELMLWADLMVGAGGSSSWERCCLGLPSLLILTAENQRHICEALDKRGIARFLGDADKLNPAAVHAAVREMISKPDDVRAMSERASRICDGDGAKRLVKQLQAPEVTVRRVKIEDSRLIWQWANDASVRAVSFSQEEIEWNTHEQWFAAKLANRQCFFFIGEVDGVPSGQIRFDRYDGEMVVSVNTSPEERGRGVGSELIRAGTIEFLKLKPTEPVIAFIRIDNAASIQAFLNAGYVLDGETDVRGVHAFRYRYPV